VRALLQKVNAWKMWVLCDRPAIKNWSEGRITLLGDAAHPMLQYLAQGGNMAVEDAVCLADRVEAHGTNYEAAYAAYKGLRYRRTARVQLMARLFGEIYHASGVNRELRNKLLSDWSKAGSIDMSWLYGEQPELPKVGSIPQPSATRLDR
jgi:salicylate hydroxylase